MFFDEVRKAHPDWKAVHVFSIMNPWIDCVVFAPEEQINKCAKACSCGMDDFWDFQFEAYADCLEQQLIDNDIPHEMVFGELDYDESSTTEEWDEAVSSLWKEGIMMKVA